MEHAKLLKNPFYNLQLTLEPELWIFALIKKANIITSPEITDKIQKDSLYIKHKFTFKIT